MTERTVRNRVGIRTPQMLEKTFVLRLPVAPVQEESFLLAAWTEGDTHVRVRLLAAGPQVTLPYGDDGRLLALMASEARKRRSRRLAWASGKEVLARLKQPEGARTYAWLNSSLERLRGATLILNICGKGSEKESLFPLISALQRGENAAVGVQLGQAFFEELMTGDLEIAEGGPEHDES